MSWVIKEHTNVKCSDGRKGICIVDTPISHSRVLVAFPNLTSEYIEMSNLEIPKSGIVERY